jgi:competence protein ComEA
MDHPSPLEPSTGSNPLRRLDQAAVAGLILFALVALAWYFIRQNAQRGGLIEIERTGPLAAEFQIDLNSAEWTEFTTLPEIGSAMAHRIVDYRKQHGPFRSLDDLRSVKGIGPKTMERLRPYLKPIESPVAGP